MFISKKHGPLPLDFPLKPSCMADKTKEKYPKIKVIRLPFMSHITKEISKKLVVLKKALEIALSKIPSFEFLESAFR